MMGFRPAAVLLGAVLLAAAGQAGEPPLPEAAAGWQRTGEVRSFAAATLYQYIDGDAERYLKAGVKSVSTADYSFRESLEAVADVYTMSNAAGARTVFESEAPGGTVPASVGDAAQSDAQSLLFRQGAYLVRIVAYQATAESRRALIELGRAIAQRLGR
jgi:hypothetical protein